MLLRPLLGSLVSRLIMPSQNYARDLFFHGRNSIEDPRRNIQITNHTIPSTGDAQINYCECSPLIRDEDDTSLQKIIIHAVGNGDVYENHRLEYLEELSKFPNTKVVGFNFRNVQASTGTPHSQEDWIDDAVAVIKHYQNQGVDLNNILLHGHSMGAAILTLAAARVYRESQAQAEANGQDPNTAPCPKLLNNRSFSNLAETIINLILGRIGCGIINSLVYLTPLLLVLNLPTVAALSVTMMVSSFVFEKISKSLTHPIINLGLWLSFGTIDALSAYKSLPSDAKDHIVVKNDGIIRGSAGLHAGLKSERQRQKRELRANIANPNIAEKQTYEEQLRHLKDCKVQLENNPNDGFVAHNASASQLMTYHKLRHRAENDNLAPQIDGDKVMAQKTKRLLNLK